MKKAIVIIVGLFLIMCLTAIIYFKWTLEPVDINNGEEVSFKIELGSSKKSILKKLESENLIRSSNMLYIYMFFNESDMQAGEYNLAKNMTPKTILKKFNDGDVVINTVDITLVEGKRLTDYAKTLSEKLSFSANDFLEYTSNKEYLNTLVEDEDYWFITDSILDDSIYYPLEGYLLPDTYAFLENATIKDVLKTILNYTKIKLDPLKEEITEKNYNIHDLLTMASIVEKEANTLNDRKMAAQVFYTRLKENWSLGSDVTAFYGARKEMGKDSETWDVLNGINPYNTRLTSGSMNGKLPIGPICNPSLDSITASLNPSATNYYYFVANTCTGEVFFSETGAGFNSKVSELYNMNCL